MEAKWQTGVAPDKCTWQLEKKCFLFQKRKYAKLNNVGLFVFECISCTLHLHSRRHIWSGKELWCIHEAWQREKVFCLFVHFAQVVWRKIFLIYLETLFHSFGVTTYPAYSLILDFIFSQFPTKGRLYQGLSIPIANWPISQWTSVSDCGLFTDHRRIELLRASLSAPALTLENH